MNKIELKVASRGLYILHYLGSALLAGVLTISISKFIYELNQIVFIGIFGGIWYVITRFTKKISSGMVELEILEKGIGVKWVNQIILHKRKDLIIDWVDIKDYMFQPEQYFDLLRIRTKDKRKFKFSMIGDNYDFPLFYQSLEKVIKTKSKDESIEIGRAKNIYESKYGLISTIFMGIVIVAGLIAFVFIEPKGNSKPNFGYLIASLVGGIFFIVQVISYRNKQR